jgi:Ca2+-binding RTX toxin-like protein
MFGGGGSDTADYSGATDAVFAELWRLSASNDGQGGSDVLVDIENLTGSAFTDTIAGDNNDNIFKGGAGNDAIFGGGGSDTADYSGATSGAFVELWRFTAGNDGQGGSDVLVEIENVTGSAFNDTVAGDNNNNVFKGSAGFDAFYGAGGIDTVDYSDNGRFGSVRVELWRFWASSDGQNASDTLVNIENLTGSDNNDVLAGDNNNNVFKGGPGVDAMYGTGGIDTVDYSSAASGVHVELWQLWANNDGQGGQDTLFDIENVTGSAFADVLAGDNGANRLEGAGGTDVLYGGGGADNFAYGAGSGVDYIGDFIKVQGDKILVQSNLNGSGISTGALALAHTSTIGGNAVVDLGSGNSVTLVGVTAASLAASDFVII